MSHSIFDLLKLQAERASNSVAILAPGRAPLTYGRLFRQMQDTAARLNELCIGRNDRVAVVLPNGPEMAVGFLSVVAAATSAPLNPAYRASEFEFYLSDLRARALIIQAGIESPAIEVARRLGLAVIKLLPCAEEAAGLFTLEGKPPERNSPGGFTEENDVALLLHTSGTTSRPKLVPLTHRNLCTSAENISKTLQLTPQDRCMNVMPLFHIHGLIGATLSSIVAGASVVCTPGFYAPQFFEWVKEFRPTWYTAVPTMHQAILARAASNRETIANGPLRFIRSSSAALLPQVMESLEKQFNVPVIESYGMTEASHQMASNPLPPGKRKASSVGRAAGPEIAIMDEAGRLLPSGESGEIVIRGDPVMRAYENNPEANKKAFTEGWFRTGDQGYFDDDGYLFVSGRLKEIINRGGEKISPREVEEVLMNHAAVCEAVTFALPDPKLGEEVAAAVVLRDPSVTEKELRQFAALRLTDFKVPRRLVVVDELPKGSTGKVQRIGLAEKLGLTENVETATRDSSEFVAPRNEIEKILSGLWCEVLKITPVSTNQRFLDLGGDSITATQLVSRVRQRLGVELSLLEFIDAPTIADQALVLEAKLMQEIEASPESEDHRSAG